MSFIAGILNVILVSMQRLTINIFAPQILQQTLNQRSIRPSFDHVSREVGAHVAGGTDAVSVNLLDANPSAPTTKILSNNLINTANSMTDSISLLNATTTTASIPMIVPIAVDEETQTK